MKKTFIEWLDYLKLVKLINDGLDRVISRIENWEPNNMWK